jgi:hypothetical protein
MKTSHLMLFIVFFVACSTKKEPTENEDTEEALQEELQALPTEPVYSQLVYRLDTIEGRYIVKELKSVRLVNDNVVSCTTYPLVRSEGVQDPAACDQFTLPEEYYNTQKNFSGVSDSTFSFKPSEYQTVNVHFDKEGLLTFYKSSFVKVVVENFVGRKWTKATVGYMDDRSGIWSYHIIQRKASGTFEPLPNYLTVNGENLLTKQKRSIVDYYVLATRLGLFSPEHSGGTFDIANGYFEYSDEGTGAGQYVGQLALFRAANGSDYLAINGHYAEPNLYLSHISNSPPSFYTFNNGAFEEVTSIFPSVTPEIFFPQGKAEDIRLETFFSLPRKGLAITYNINPMFIDFCKKLDEVTSIDDETREDYKKRCDQLSKRQWDSIAIKFDKAAGRFVINLNQ